MVTGAARGIGAGIAQAMAAEGANIVVVDLLADQAAEVAEIILKDGGSSISADVTDRAQVCAAIDLAVSKLGRLDAMFNNAGVNDPRGFLEIDKDNWDFINNVHGWGVSWSELRRPQSSSSRRKARVRSSTRPRSPDVRVSPRSARTARRRPPSSP